MCDQFLGEKLGLQDATETQNLDIWTKKWDFPTMLLSV